MDNDNNNRNKNAVNIRYKNQIKNNNEPEVNKLDWNHPLC